jgi:MFS family permease
MARAHHNINISRSSSQNLVPVFAVTLFLIFHTFVVAYMNSSFLEQFISTTAVGTIYTIGSALTVLIFLFISKVLHKVGNYNMTLSMLILDMLAVVGMAYTTELRTAVPLFLIHIISVSLIIFNLDVFMEEKIGNNETTTGSKRGLLLTLSSLIGAVTPLISSLLINNSDDGFTNAYLLSAATLVPIIVILIIYFRNFSDPEYTEIDLFSAIRTFWRKVSVRYVFLANFSLQVFFVLMVVYTPLYLTHEMGFTWTQFGLIMLFAQSAYVFFEYPIGIIADKYIGEKEMMGMGFLIITISTSWMAFFTMPSLIIWSIIMFITRVGASLVEVTTESYFFKQTKSSDAQIISFFRLTRPLAYVVGALIASLTLLYLPFNLLFIVFALLMIPAMFCSVNIVDTK